MTEADPTGRSTAPAHLTTLTAMKLFGYVIGIIWLGIAFGAFRTSAQGWADGHSDIGFWWAVIGSFLTIAALGALVGTSIHARSRPQH